MVIDVSCSSWIEIPSGVPQGSILGPLFFVIFINDISEAVSPGNAMALYADDCKSSRIIECMNDQTIFQEDLNKLYNWSQYNHIEFNVKKCTVMSITKKKHPYSEGLSLGGTDLDEVKVKMR